MVLAKTDMDLFIYDYYLFTAAEPVVILPNGNSPTLPRCGKEAVVPCGLHSHDVNVNDDDDCYLTVHSLSNLIY